jgi:hypothetical protein
MKRPNPLSISKIRVVELFGYYTYTIPNDKKSDNSQLLILYGDNGSGKTTILKLLFWLLSSKARSGYKSKIGQTAFRSFAVTFKNGIEIGAVRKGAEIIGTFDYYIKKGKQTLYSMTLNAVEDNSIDPPKTTEENEAYKQILGYVRQLDISVFYLSDDRKILNSLTSTIRDPEAVGDIVLSESDVVLSSKYERVGVKRLLDERKFSVDSALERLIDWVRTKIITGSKAGEKQSQAIYTDLMKNILKQEGASRAIKTKVDMMREIERVAASARPFVRLGLVDPFDSKTIIDSIQNVKKPRQFSAISSVLRPYLESIGLPPTFQTVDLVAEGA